MRYKFNNKYLYYLLIVLLLIFFIFRLTQNATTIRFGISPDENEHIDISSAYSKVDFMVTNNPETYRFGPIANSPYLFYRIMGYILNIVGPGDHAALWLRIANIIFSVINVIFTLKLATLLSKSRIVHLLALLIITNIPMLTFLSSSVSYDNLANMLATCAIYYTIAFYKSGRLNYLLLIIIFSCLGILTKITIIPLVLAISVVVLISILRRRPSKQDFTMYFNKNLKKKAPLLILTTFLMLLVCNLYLVNVYKYKAVIPRCTQVMSEDSCLQNLAVKRDLEYANAKVAFDPIDPYHYISEWGNWMIVNTFGIFGHEKLYKSAYVMVLYDIVLKLSIVGLIRTLKTKSAIILILIGISMFYLLVLAFYQNYQTYLSTGEIQVALQGRYAFPVLAPLVVLVAKSVLDLSKNQYYKLAIFLFVAIVFIFGDYIHFKRNVPATWYSSNVLSTASGFYVQNKVVNNTTYEL
jgi:hypothetical protein